MKERLKVIKEFIDKAGSVSFKDLETAFPTVSSMTLRRDLIRLEENNEIKRVLGGAISIDSIVKTKEIEFNERIKFKAEEKLEIADKTVQLVERKSCIFIDGGSTTTYFARALPDDSYYVLTNAFSVAETVLRKDKPLVAILGGDVMRTHLITVGKSCEDFIGNVNIQTAIMTATGYVPETFSFTCGSQAEVEIKRAVIKNAQKVIMLLDGSKVDKRTPYNFATLFDIDCMVVDKKFPQDIKAQIEGKNIKVY